MLHFFPKMSRSELFLIRVIGGGLALSTAILCLAPRLKAPASAPAYSDLFVHFALFSALAFVLGLAWFRWRKVIVTLVFSLAIGLEVGQLVVPVRQFDWSDLSANVAGVLFGLFVARFCLRRGVSPFLGDKPAQ